MPRDWQPEHPPPGRCPFCGMEGANRLVSAFVGEVDEDGRLGESLVKVHRRFCDDCAYSTWLTLRGTINA